MFAKQLEYYKIPEWSAYYIDYSYLKKMIYDCQMARMLSVEPHEDEIAIKETNIKESFKKQFYKINRFYISQSSASMSDLNSIFKGIRIMLNDSVLKNHEIQHVLNLDGCVSDNALCFRESLSNLHKRIWWLEVFCEVNYISALRLIDKVEHPIDLISLLKEQEFSKYEKELGEMRKLLYEKVAQEFLGGDILEAMKLLTRTSKYYRLVDIGWIYFSIGVTIASLVIAFVLISLSEKTVFGGIFLCFSIFRLTLSINFVFIGASWLIYMLESHSLNWMYIFEIDPSNRISYMQILRLGLTLNAVWSFFFLTKIAHSFGTGLVPRFNNSSAILFLGIYVFLLVCPFNIMHKNARMRVLKTLAEVVIAPFGPVKFRNYMLASWLTSMTIPLRDFYLTMCYIIGNLWNQKEKPPCSTDVLTLTIISALPFIWRLMQVCNKIYYDPPFFRKQYVNLVRYGQSLFIIYISYLGLQKSQQAYIWISVFIICSEFTMFLDYYQDWGLVRNSKNGCLLRENLYFEKKLYYFIMICNGFLRYAWSLSLLPLTFFENDYFNAEIILMLMCILELFRRTLWTLLRIERERSENTEKYRKIDYIPKPLKTGEFMVI
ncbi:unnamed protein product [Blepharisma stoltei]|uniref:Uncharacterized protein n=1 Tax=Blepharisma stoltei TaxID=1481888 RepID=A0AAU9JQI3_9CILI|nr:unnamed protein product [Blepharisma stoltei]